MNKNGNIEKKTGWKKVAGKYAYYVNSNGAVSHKITKGKYYKWSNGQFKKQPVRKNSTKTIQGKAFYVNKNGNIEKKNGWKKVAGKYTYYVGTKGSVLYKETAKGTYEITSVGKVSDKLMKNGWNGSVFVKNGKVQIKTTVTVGGYINAFDEDGKRVTLKKSGNNIVRSDTNEPVTTKGAYKVGSGSNKTTYYVTNNGNIKKNGTVTVNGVKYTVDASGKCTKVTENGSDNSDPKKDDPGSKQHVCKWLVVLDKNQNPVQSNYKKHDAVMGTENQLIRDAWDEPIYAARKWLVCNTCSGELGIDDQDCAYENTAELDKHQDAVHHGGNHLVKKIIDYKHHDAEYADVPVIKKRAYEECDYTYKCTVCGDTMTEHVVWGDTENSSACAYIPNKSGDMLYADGSGVCQVVTKNTPYGTIGIDLAEPAYLTLLKDHGFIK